MNQTEPNFAFSVGIDASLYFYSSPAVKGVMLEASKDEVKVTGTMDVATMVLYLTEKLNLFIEVVAPVKNDKKKDKGKGSEMAGPSMHGCTNYTFFVYIRNIFSTPSDLKKCRGFSSTLIQI